MSAKPRSELELALLALEEHYATQAAVLRVQNEQLRRFVARSQLPARPQLRLIAGGKEQLA